MIYLTVKCLLSFISSNPAFQSAPETCRVSQTKEYEVCLSDQMCVLDDWME